MTCTRSLLAPTFSELEPATVQFVSSAGSGLVPVQVMIELDDEDAL
jgi:hypothetical protein